MSLTWHIGILLGFGLVLSGSAQLVIKAVTTFSQRLKISNFTIAFLLLGILTSTPEMFVALQSALSGVPQLSVGNLIGGSLLLLSLLMGVSSVVMGTITLDHGLTFNELILISAVVAAPAAVLWDGHVSRLDGVFLAGFYFLHVLLINKEQHVLRYVERRSSKIGDGGYQGMMLLVGFLGMAIASHSMVGAAESIMSMFHMPAFIFGLVLLSLGTNLPEFALAFEATMARRRTIAFGDFLGSAAANTLILGILAIVMPFRVSSDARLWFSLALLLIIPLFFMWAVSSKRDINRREGIGLLFFYLMFLAFELFGS